MHHSDSDQSSNSEPQNKRRSQLSGVSMRGSAAVDWSSTATSVQISDTIDWYEHALAAAASADLGSPERDGALLFAKLGNLTCHERVRKLHADVSSAAAEIYAASMMLSHMMYLLYVNEELGIPYALPIEIAVDNTTTIAFASGMVKKSKMRHIDARQDWVQALRDGNLVKLVKVNTKDNLADLGTKLLDPETFERLRNGMMVCHPIPATNLELGSHSDSEAPATLVPTQVPLSYGVGAPKCATEVLDVSVTHAPHAVKAVQRVVVHDGCAVLDGYMNTAG